MRCRQTNRQPPLLLLCLFVIVSYLVIDADAQGDPSLDYSCGTDWVNAANACHKHCQSGRDEECADLGEEFGCYYFTGCKARFEELKKEQEELAALEGENEDEVIVEVPPEQNQFCAPIFIEAMLQCNKEKACPNGNECGEGEECFGNTNCDRELKELVSDMVFNLQGVSGEMEPEDVTIFINTIHTVLKASLSDVKIHLEKISVPNQRYYSDIEVIEASVSLTAKYRPPPRQKLDSIIENSINLQRENVRLAIKQAGNDAKRWLFANLQEVSAVSRENATNRPTVSPTGAPTFSPTAVPSSHPSASPSMSPSASPSDVPSSSPSRMHIQEVTTATSNELKSSSDGSYGIIFNIRTVSNGPVVLITGLDFYTESTDFVGFELWSRLGSFTDYKGMYDGWDLISSGVVKGAGYGKLTSIPTNMFTEVAIPGRGGERAFYLTLNSMDLIYRPSGVESGESDSRIHASSPELEIYEGEAVLSYPFPDPTQAYLYRSPRLFVGAVQYDRIPCKPYSLYGPVIDLPCAEIPTMAPTKRPTPQPSELFSTAEPTVYQTALDLPSMSPLFAPSQSPSVSLAPTTTTSPTLYPTLSPVALIRAYIVVTLHNTSDRDMSEGENDSFFDMFVPFLRKHCEMAMMIEDIDLWSEEQITVAASLASDSTFLTPVVATRAIEGLPTVRATKLTLILQISSTTLPLNLLGNMAVVAIEENQDELLTEIGVLGDFYLFFKNVDMIVSYSISSVTSAPVTSPAEKGKDLQGLSELSSGEETATPAGVITGVTVAIIWMLLAIFSILYLTKVRSKMKDKRVNDETKRIDSLDPDTIDASSIFEDKSDKSDPNHGRRIGSSKIEVSRSLNNEFSSRRHDGILSRSMPVLQGQELSMGYIDDDLDGMEIGVRQNLRSSLNRSGSQRDLNLRGSLRDSVTRDDGQGDLRASLRRSDSQSSLRGSLRSSLNRSGSQRDLNLRGSLRDSVTRNDGQGNLRASMQRRESMRGSLRSSLKRSAGQRDLNLRGSLRDSVRLSDSEDDLRSSMRRSESQTNLRASLRDSVSRNDGQSNLRASLRRSGSQKSVRDLGSRNDGQDNLRSSLQKGGSQNNLRASLRRSGSQNDLRGSIRDPPNNDGQSNLRESLRESIRRNDAQDNLRSSLRRTDSQNDLRGSGSRILRRSESQNNLRGSGSSGNRTLRRGESQSNLRGSGSSGNKTLRRSESQSELRGSGNSILKNSGSNEDLLGSSNLRGSGNRDLRGSGQNELTVSFLEELETNDVPMQRGGRGTHLSRSMTALNNLDIAREVGKEEDLRRSDGNMSGAEPKAANENNRRSRRSTVDGGRVNLADLKGSFNSGNDSTLRRSVREQRSGALGNSRGSANTTGRRGNGTHNNNGLRRSGNDNNNLRASGGRGRRSALSQSMTSLRSPGDSLSGLGVNTDNERPTSRLRSSVKEQSSRNGLRSSMKSERPAMSQSMTRRPNNERPAGRLRNSTGSQQKSGKELRSSIRGGGLTRSRTERPDSGLRRSSIEQRSVNNLRSSARGDRMRLSQSLRVSDTANARRTTATVGNDRTSDSNFGELVRQASARRSKRRASADSDKNDIETLKRNLIL